MALKIGIAEPGDFSERALSILRGIGDVSTYDPQKQPLQGFISDKHVLFVRLKHYWGEELLKAARELRYLCSPTTGLTHIDITYAGRAGITVISLKGETEFLSTVSATAEHTFGLALALLRRYGHAFVRENNTAWDRERYKGYELKGMKAGIIGMGRVGTQLCGYLSAFGAEVFYCDVRRDAENPHNAKRMDPVASLVDAAQMIFLCASFEEKNRGMINAGVLERMRGKYFINTARGEMVDEKALLLLASEGHFAGLALDVLDGEPGTTRVEEFAALADSQNIIVTPHIGGATYTSMWATEEFIAGKLVKIQGFRG